MFLIADDHPMVRDALASALGQAFAGAGIAMAGSLAQVQAALEREPETDALLLDLDMPGMDGLTGLALLRSGHPTVPIIVVSAAREAGIVRRAYDFGASAYIDKSASLEEIAGTVRAVLGGEIFAPPDPAPADSFAQRANQLTPQQWRVLALMVQGDQNKQIAYKLGVGEATVKAHVTVILRKLGVRSRTQAVIEARGLTLPPV
jgi:DNA-binding NarL/FixJ family response regulator